MDSGVLSPHAEIDAPTLRQMLWQGRAVLIDVREREEFEEEHIPGATLIPLSSFDPCLLAGSIENRPVVIHCLAGSRAEKAAAALAEFGHRAVMTLKDGLFGWKGAGYRTNATAEAD